MTVTISSVERQLAFSTTLDSRDPAVEIVRIGSGIPLFNGPFEPHMFHPVDETLLDSGVRILPYDRAPN